MEYSEDFKNRFLELIEDFECKKSEIPLKLNIDYNIYKKIIEFGIIPKPIILMRIADYFEASIEYLLGTTNKNEFYKSEQPVTFLDRYNGLKKEKGFNDYKIAQKLHISTSYTTNWQKKGFMPSLSNLIILSQVFEVSLDYLLGRTDIKK